MNSDTVIKIEGLGKRYRLGTVTQAYDTLRDAAVRWFRSTQKGTLPETSEEAQYLWALRNVDLEIKRGEVLGVIGPNGAGKSTLLKILSRITSPTEGRAEVRGRIGTLLEVGTGFHPELTGRENIYLNGEILGMTRREIKSKFDEIVDFAGTEKFLDTPVKRYSSGMYVRLAFAVAAHLNPEILLVDEVLAVGDAAFQKKCLGKMEDVASGGRTVFFVSHNMSAIEQLCTKTAVIKDGNCRLWDKTSDAVLHYLGSGAANESGWVDLTQARRWNDNRAKIITWISLHDHTFNRRAVFETGEKLIIRVGYKVQEPMSAYCQINVLNRIGDRLMTLHNSHSNTALQIDGEGYMQCVIPELRLVEGEFDLMIEFGRQSPRCEWIDCIPNAVKLKVTLGDYLGGSELKKGQGIIAQRTDWSVSK